jgi:hypothetical protein
MFAQGIHPDGRAILYGRANTNVEQLIYWWHSGGIGIGTGGSARGGAVSYIGDTSYYGPAHNMYFMETGTTFGPLNVKYRLAIGTTTNNTSFASGVSNNTTNIESNNFTYIARSHTFNTGTTSGNQGLPNQFTPLHLSTSGSVGINTLTPITTLDVSGSGRFTNNLIVTGSLTVITGSLIEFQVNQTGVKIGNLTTDAHSVTGSFSISSSSGTGSALYAYKSGSTVLDIQGSQGQLFSVTDALSGSLMSVNDVSGLPILEVFSDDRVVIGTYGAPALTVTGSTLRATGSLLGTASYATTALSASFASTASYATTAAYALDHAPIPTRYICNGYLTTDQSFATGSDAVIKFEDYDDPNGWLAGYRFTPTIAGYYHIDFGVWLANPGSTTNQANVQIRKNGVTHVIIQQPLNNSVGQSLAGSKIIYFNGSTDQIDFTVFQAVGSSATGTILQGTPDGSGTWFSAFLVTQ